MLARNRWRELAFRTLSERISTKEKELAIFLRGQLNRLRCRPRCTSRCGRSIRELPVFGSQTLDDCAPASLSERRFSMEMVALFALTALLLAGLGIYGTISYLVSERGHELAFAWRWGRKGRILAMVLRQGLGLALGGTAVD